MIVCMSFITMQNWELMMYNVVCFPLSAFAELFYFLFENQQKDARF